MLPISLFEKMTLTGRKLIMESYFETGKYIEILGKQISWYAILGFIGLMAALFLCVKRRRRFDIARGDVINLMAYSIIGIIAGSKLLALICMTPDIIKNFSHIQWNAHTVSVLMQSGFVFYGGLMGVIAAFYIYCRQFGLSFRSVMELSAPSIPLFHFFGRLGCFTAGCCYGIGGFPVQLVEAAINLMIFAVIILVQNQDKLRGKTFCLYLLLYTSVRFVLEFYRGDPERGFIGPLSVSQWISALLFLAAVFYLRRLRKA